MKVTNVSFSNSALNSNQKSQISQSNLDNCQPVFGMKMGLLSRLVFNKVKKKAGIMYGFELLKLENLLKEKDGLICHLKVFKDIDMVEYSIRPRGFFKKSVEGRESSRDFISYLLNLDKTKLNKNIKDVNRVGERPIEDDSAYFEKLKQELSYTPEKFSLES